MNRQRRRQDGRDTSTHKSVAGSRSETRREWRGAKETTGMHHGHIDGRTRQHRGTCGRHTLRHTGTHIHTNPYQCILLSHVGKQLPGTLQHMVDRVRVARLRFASCDSFPSRRMCHSRKPSGGGRFAHLQRWLKSRTVKGTLQYHRQPCHTTLPLPNSRTHGFRQAYTQSYPPPPSFLTSPMASVWKMTSPGNDARIAASLCSLVCAFLHHKLGKVTGCTGQDAAAGRKAFVASEAA